jgi:hypothetical protein
MIALVTGMSPDRRHKSSELGRPIIVVASPEAGVTGVEVTEHAVAVKFQFVKPFVPEGLRSTRVASCGATNSGISILREPGARLGLNRVGKLVSYRAGGLSSLRRSDEITFRIE